MQQLKDVWKEPYSDNMMVFEEASGRYYLTEEAMRAAGCELRANLSDTMTAQADTIIRIFLRRVTQQVYAFIHAHNARTDLQDAFLAHLPDLRGVLMEALLTQATYNYLSGDLSFSTDKGEREMNINWDPYYLFYIVASDDAQQCPIHYGGNSIIAPRAIPDRDYKAPGGHHMRAGNIHEHIRHRLFGKQLGCCLTGRDERRIIWLYEMQKATSTVKSTVGSLRSRKRHSRFMTAMQNTHRCGASARMNFIGLTPPIICGT